MMLSQASKFWLNCYASGSREALIITKPDMDKLMMPEACKGTASSQCWAWCSWCSRCGAGGLLVSRGRRPCAAAGGAFRRTDPNTSTDPPRVRLARIAGESGQGWQEQRLPCGLMPSQVSELLDRDITPEDYEMLLQLDEALERPLPAKESEKLQPVATTEEHLGETCAICLHAFERTDSLSALPTVSPSG
eukprot:s548_g7.t2